MGKLLRRAVVLAKIETTPGVDIVPTGADAMLVSNWQVNPLEQQVEKRDLVRPFLGNSESILVAEWSTMEFEVEVAGAGAAGGIPRYDALLRMCGRARTVNAGVSVVYSLLSDNQVTGTLYTNVDGVLYKMVYTMGNCVRMLDARKVPKYRFTMTGLYLPVTDAAPPTPDFSGWVKPIAVNKAHTTGSLHGFGAFIEKLQIDDKNQVEYRNLIGFEGVQITDRAPEGNISLEMTSVAAKNWFEAIRDTDTGALEIVHGTTDGNIVEFDYPAVRLHGARFSNSQGIQMLDCTIELVPGTSGNDEETITVR